MGRSEWYVAKGRGRRGNSSYEERMQANIERNNAEREASERVNLGGIAEAAFTAGLSVAGVFAPPPVQDAQDAADYGEYSIRREADRESGDINDATRDSGDRHGWSGQ